MTKPVHDEQLSLDQASDQASHDRIWDHGKHAESVFLNQLNFFLIFESLLLGGVINGVLVNQHLAGKPVLIGITIFGCFITLFWTWIQYCQGYLFEKVKRRMEEQIPEYKETLKQRREGKKKFSTFIEFTNNLEFQAISIPGSVALVWLGLLLYIFFS